MDFVSPRRLAKHHGHVGRLSWLYESVLGVIASIAVLMRCFSVVRFESIIHEYDPWFNYRCAEYMVSNGLRKYFSWFDDRSWIPKGRFVGGTSFPGLMMLSAGIHWLLNDILALDIELRDICVFTGPAAASLACMVICAFTADIAADRIAGILAALFLAILPGYISRSVAGSYDYESIGIALMLATFFFWLRAIKRRSKAYAFLASLSYSCLAATWGGYVYVLNLIPLHTVASVLLTGYAAMDLARLYSVYYLTSILLISRVPVIGWAPLTSIEHWPALLVFIGLPLLPLVTKHRTALNYRLAAGILALLSLAAAIAAAKVGIRGRLFRLFFGSRRRSALVTSISEHMPPSWSSLFRDTHLALPFSLPALHWLAAQWTPEALFVLLYALTAAFFAAQMIRIILILAPAVCILAGISCARFIRSSPTPSSLLLLILLWSFARHSLNITTTVYSTPTVIMTMNRGGGRPPVHLDDFREAYSWLRHNTRDDASVLAWWDYGYQLAGMSGRRTYADNNTNSVERISTIAQILLMEDEHEAWAKCNEWKVDVLMITYGGLVGWNGDDLSKSYWFARIASEAGLVAFDDFLVDGVFRVNDLASDRLKQSLLYRLTYHGLPPGRRDSSRGLNVIPAVAVNCFEEIFTTEHSLVRFYSPKSSCTASA